MFLCGQCPQTFPPPRVSQVSLSWRAQLVYEGNASIAPAEITLDSVAPTFPLLYDVRATPNTDAPQTTVRHINPHVSSATQVTREQLDEVERQQKAFQ